MCSWLVQVDLGLPAVFSRQSVAALTRFGVSSDTPQIYLLLERTYQVKAGEGTDADIKAYSSSCLYRGIYVL